MLLLMMVVLMGNDGDDHEDDINQMNSLYFRVLFFHCRTNSNYDTV